MNKIDPCYVFSSTNYAQLSYIHIIIYILPFIVYQSTSWQKPLNCGITVVSWLEMIPLTMLTRSSLIYGMFRNTTVVDVCSKLVNAWPNRFYLANFQWFSRCVFIYSHYDASEMSMAEKLTSLNLWMSGWL